MNKNKMKLLCDSNPMCYGSSTALLAVVEALPAAELIMLGGGITGEVFRRGGVLCDVRDIYPKDTAAVQSLVERERFDAVLVVSNQANIQTYIDSDLPIFFVDILYWYGASKQQPFWQVVEHAFVQAFPGVAQRLQTLSNTNIEMVGPLIRPTLAQTSTPRSKGTLVNLGGGQSRWVEPGKNSNYHKLIAKLLITMESALPKPIMVAGGEAIIKAIGQELPEHIQARSLPQPKFLEALNECELYMSAPGLNAIFEGFASKAPMAFLPPQNTSQVFQLDRFEDAGLVSTGLNLHALCQVEGVSLEQLEDEETMTMQVLSWINTLADNPALTSRAALHLMEQLSEIESYTLARQNFWASLGPPGGQVIAQFIEEWWRQKTSPTISVVIPTMGTRPQMLLRALNSVEQQTLQPDELIISVDPAGEPEASIQALVGTRARIICATTSGVSAVRNAGVSSSRGDFIAFLDDDDEWASVHLEHIFEDTYDFDLAVTGLNKHRPGGSVEPYKQPPGTLSTADFLVRNPGLQGSNIVVRRTLLYECGGFDERLYALEDMDLGIRLLGAGARYQPVPSVAVAYHCHELPRLTSRESSRAKQGARRFLAKWGHRMTSSQQDSFRERALNLWGDDPGRWTELDQLNDYTSTALLWICGPPGAGKSTWAQAYVNQQQDPCRVLDVGALMAPLQLTQGKRPGMLKAKRHLIEALRELAHPAQAPERLIVTLSDPMLLPQLWPCREREALLVLLPEEPYWEEQLSARPPRILPSSNQENALAQYRQWQLAIEHHQLPQAPRLWRPELIGINPD